MKFLAIFSNDLEFVKNNISNIINNQKYDDIVIFTDFFITNYNLPYSIFSSFYMKFYPGEIVFLNETDYNKYAKAIVGQPILYGAAS